MTEAIRQSDLNALPPLRFGSVLVEPGRRLARGSNGAEQVLEPRVVQVLIALARANGDVLSREALRSACWEGRVVGDDAIGRIIARIRRLRDEFDEPAFEVETISKAGYRLADVHSAETPEPGEPLPEPIAVSSAAPAGMSRRGLILAAAGGGVVVTAGALGWRRWRAAGALPAAGTSPLVLAVLPFRAAEQGAVPASFARQLSDAVRADLSRMRDIRVIAETSSRTAVDEARSAAEIGRLLGASLLVEGQVGDGGAQASVALIDARDQRQLWSETAQGPAGDMLGLRTAISGALIQQVAGLVPAAGPRSDTPVRRPDPQAYAYVSEANRLLEHVRTSAMRGRREDALTSGERARQLAQQALAVDGRDSSALVVLATIARNGWTPALAAQPLTTLQRVEQSVAILRRALLAEPDNPAALTQLGDYYRRFAFRWDEAENLFRRALRIDPSLVEAHWSYGYQLGTLGRAQEGLDHALSVFELDPRNPFRRLALPRLLYILGRREEAMSRYEVELEREPENLFLQRELYFMLLSEGRGEALTALTDRLSRLRERRPATQETDALDARIAAGAEALSGRPERLRAMIDADVADYDRPIAVGNATPQGRARDDLPFIFAIEYAWVDAPDRAIDMLDRALTAKSLYWPATLPFGVAPLPAAVQQHPRFAPLWQRDPGLRQLLRSRRGALESGQMAGVMPGGRHLVPALAAGLQPRVAAALARG